MRIRLSKIAGEEIFYSREFIIHDEGFCDKCARKGNARQENDRNKEAGKDKSHSILLFFLVTYRTCFFEQF